MKLKILRRNINFSEALRELKEKKLIKCPEWEGYWFMRGGQIWVRHFDGRESINPWLKETVLREDWQVVETVFDASDFLNATVTVRPIKNSIQILTELQDELGYKKGQLSTVAMFGLVGEAGEVLTETFSTTLNSKFQDDALAAIKYCKRIDQYKKDIRKGLITINLEIGENNISSFNSELADTFYYLNALAINVGLTIYDLAKMAHDKIREKQAAGGSSEDPKFKTT